MSSAAVADVAVGVDIGGTFTDIVCALPDGEVRLLKLPSVPGNQNEAVRAAISTNLLFLMR